MAMTSKTQILTALPKLPKADLEAIHAMAGHLLGAPTAAKPRKASAIGTIIFDALCATLGARMPYTSLGPKLARQFEKQLPPLRDFLDSEFEGWDKNKNSQIAFLRMLFGLVADDLKGRGLKPSMGIMITNIIRVPEVFDNSFPDYRNMGVSKVVLDKFQ